MTSMSERTSVNFVEESRAHHEGYLLLIGHIHILDIRYRGLAVFDLSPFFEDDNDNL